MAGEEKKPLEVSGDGVFLRWKKVVEASGVVKSDSSATPSYTISGIDVSKVLSNYATKKARIVIEVRQES